MDYFETVRKEFPRPLSTKETETLEMFAKYMSTGDFQNAVDVVLNEYKRRSRG
jgi:hypothetical protein